MRHILDKLISTLEQGKSAVLGTVIRSSGSAPRSSGARMLILSDGTLRGSVGGGPVEAACQTEAKKLFGSLQTYTVLDFELTPTVAVDAGMVCGGSVSILLHKIEPTTVVQFQQLRRSYSEGSCPFLLTVLPKKKNPPLLLTLGAGQDSDVSDELREKILIKSRRTPFTTHHKGQDIFIEPLVHPGTIHLIGAGHVALSTAHLAAYVGFEVVVMDDRPEFANTERYPQAKAVHVLNGFDNCLNKLGPNDYVIIVTRSHLHDRDVLAQALQTDASYIGMIGSSRKRKAVYASLQEKGFSDTDLQRVHSPIGLFIGADTPEEIGVSIVAELVQVRAGKTS